MNGRTSGPACWRTTITALGVMLAVLWLAPGFLTALEVAERDAINPGLGAAPADVDRATPERTWHSFLTLAAAGSLRSAAHCLDLTELPEDQQAATGSLVAGQLFEVMDAVGKSAAGAPPSESTEPADSAFVVVEFSADGVAGEVWLRRTLDLRSGETFWMVTRRTVSEVPQWHRAVVEGVVEEAVDLNPGLGAAPETVARANPQEMVVAYLVACREGRFEGASHYLDLSARPANEQAEAGRRLARRLKIALDQTFWVVPEAISKDPAGLPEADLETDQERLTTIDVEGSPVDVLLRRHLLADGSRVWTFDPVTVASIDRLYAAHGYGWMGDHLPAFFFTVRPWEVELWQWCGMVVLGLVGWLLARVLAPLILSLLTRASRQSQVEWDDALVAALAGPLRLGILATFLFVTLPWLHLSVAATGGLEVVWRLAAVLILGWLLSQWVNVGSTILERSAVTDANQVARSFVPIFSRILKVMVWAVVLVVGLQTVGFEVMGLVAGLGIGGLAFAFAAQRTIENLFGAFAIASDRPFEVGQFVNIGGTSGTVEEVGLRSTRVRTLAHSLVTLPNGKVMSEKIENFAARERILYNPTIGLLYGSTTAQLEYVIDEIKKLLAGHPTTYHDLVRVRLDSFGDSAINISVLTWITTTDYNEFTAVKEELNFGIMKIVEEAGTGFAFPSQTIYTASDDGIDQARASAAESEVSQRRAAGELWIPEAPAAEEE